MLRSTSLVLVTVTMLVACSGGTSPGVDDGGASSSSGDPAATSSGSPGASSSGTLPSSVTSSPHFQRCELACKRPGDGPCASGDTAECIQSCTVALEGASSACAQCVLEDSGWSGLACGDESGCTGCCKCGPDAFGPGPTSGNGCVSNCPTAKFPKTCDRTEEKCTGFKLAKRSSSSCGSACQ